MAKTLVASPFEDDAAEILDCYSHTAGFVMRDRIFMGQRVGQAFMNTLFEYDPEGYAKLSGSLVDPFYEANNIPAALDKLTTK